MANPTQITTSNGKGLMGSGGPISRMNSSARQGSNYAVTLDELQKTLIEPGVNFGSIYMDVCLKNIWTVEESQAMAAAINVTRGSSENAGNSTPIESNTPMIRQSNLVSKHGFFSDENESPDSGLGVKSIVEQRGEVTLEAFLLKAGLVFKDDGLVESSYLSIDGTGGESDRGNENGEIAGPGSLAAPLSLSRANGLGPQTDGLDGFRQGQAEAQQQQVQGQVDCFPNIQQQQAHQQFHQKQQGQIFQAPYAMSKRVTDGGTDSNMSSNGSYTELARASSSDGVGHSQGNGRSLSPVCTYGVDGSINGVDKSWRGRPKRGAGRLVEKVVERMHKRMIKNRESAMRSRARKQAYSVELETEVTQLKAENHKLRKMIEEEVLKRKKMVLDNIINGQTQDESRVLRRTRTGPW